MRIDFLGRVWQFPVARDAHSRIRLTSDEQNIEDSIWIVLATAPYERVMRPDFGCGIHRLVFEVNETATLGKIKQEVHAALVRWEPRIDVIDVDVETKDRGEE